MIGCMLCVQVTRCLLLNKIFSIVSTFTTGVSRSQPVFLVHNRCFSLQFREFVKPYTHYCLHQKQCVSYMKSQFKGNELFRNFVRVSKKFILFFCRVHYIYIMVLITISNIGMSRSIYIYIANGNAYLYI